MNTHHITTTDRDMTDNEHLTLTIESAHKGARIDKALAELLPAYSRSAIQQWFKHGGVSVNDAPVKPKFTLAGGERVTVTVPPVAVADWQAQPMALEIVYRDDDIFVVNKPAGLVVHPGAGQADGTLLNGLLHADDALRALPRAGIVHRLDKDTSGLLVVARNEIARRELIAQLSARSVKRGYVAVANGVMIAGERIAQPVGRHRRDRLRMCVTDAGKEAVTVLRVSKKFRAHCLLRAELETGRTHQIRVHLHWRGFPLVGDKLYAGRLQIPRTCAPALAETLRAFNRQALHAAELALLHPRSGAPMEWHAPLPDDLQNLISALETDYKNHSRRSQKP